MRTARRRRPSGRRRRARATPRRRSRSSPTPPVSHAPCRIAGEGDGGEHERERREAQRREIHRSSALSCTVSSSRSSAQRACSASSSSSPSACAVQHARASRASRLARVAERDERVPAQPARVVARDVEPREQVVVESRRRPRARRPGRRAPPVGLEAGAAALDAAVPGADVLADVAAVHLRAERGAVVDSGSARAPASSRRGSGWRRGRRARRGRRSGRRRCSACRSRSPGSSARVGLELGGGDERPEHDPGAVARRDQHRVLAVEADARSARPPRGRRAGSRRRARGRARRARGRARRASRGARRSRRGGRSAAAVPKPARTLGLGRPVAERRGDDAAGALERAARGGTTPPAGWS